MDQTAFDAHFFACFRKWFESRVPVVNGEVVVVGAGIAGLTIALAMSLRNSRVRVVAANFDTPTAASAAAVWIPFLSDDFRTADWSRETFELLSGFLRATEKLEGTQNLSDAAKGCPSNSICWVDSLTLSVDASELFDSVPEYVPNRVRVTDATALPPTWLAGVRWTSIVMQSHLHLPMLRRLLLSRAGVAFEQRVVTDLHAAAPAGGVLFNCTGLGSAALVGDKLLHPIQGQVSTAARGVCAARLLMRWKLVKIANTPGRTLRFVDTAHRGQDASGELAYIIPRADCTILGGTAVVGATTLPDAAVTRAILERCERLEPGIAQNARILREYVDLRPARTGSVRLECERLPNGAALVHAYGFGGSGWTVHLGAARAALQALATATSARL